MNLCACDNNRKQNKQEFVGPGLTYQQHQLILLVLFGPIWYKVSWSAYPQDVQHSETRYHRDQEGSGRHRPLQPGCSGIGYLWHRHVVIIDHAPWQVNNTLYISGQIGFIPETMEVIKGGVVAETKQALTNMGGWNESQDPCNYTQFLSRLHPRGSQQYIWQCCQDDCSTCGYQWFCCRQRRIHQVL